MSTHARSDLWRQKWTAVALLTACALFSGRGQALAESSLAGVIAKTEPKIVKIYGAGGVSGLNAYQSGFLISADGYILTAWSYVLDTDHVTAILDDGHRYVAELKGIDPRLELAVLKIDATDLSFFDLSQSVPVEEGNRVLAFSNLFNVATGDEPASVLHGVLSVQTHLEARRGVFETPYQGPIYVVDAMTNNPGAPGGALTDWHGQLLGMLGKELLDSRSNTWLNYAIPLPQLAEAAEAIRAGKARPAVDKKAKKPAHSLDLALLGIVLVPNVLDRTPPFVDAVRSGSPAALAGVKADDLVLFVDNQLVQSCAALGTELERIDREDELHVTLMRGGDLIEVTLKAPPDSNP